VKQEKQRQKKRKTFLTIMFLLFPLLYYYFSPYLIIMGASEGVVTGSFIIFIALFIASLFMGRAFCGWVCPAGGQQELSVKLRDIRFKGGRRDWFKYFIWAPWLMLIAFIFISAGGIRYVDFFYQTYYGLSISNFESLILFLMILIIIAVVALVTGRRGFCHTACWMAPFMIIGRRMRNATGLPALSIKANQSRCIDCQKCSESCPMSLDVHGMVKSNYMENDECILCATCSDVCPNSVVELAFCKLNKKKGLQ